MIKQSSSYPVLEQVRKMKNLAALESFLAQLQLPVQHSPVDVDAHMQVVYQCQHQVFHDQVTVRFGTMGYHRGSIRLFGGRILNAEQFQLQIDVSDSKYTVESKDKGMQLLIESGSSKMGGEFSIELTEAHLSQN